MKKLINKALVKRAQYLHKQFEDFLPEEGKVLDIGSGTGHTGDEILSKTNLEVTEIDVTDMSMGTRKPIVFDGAIFPFKDKTFDVALAIHILQYTPSDQGLVEEGLRVADRFVLIKLASPTGIRRIPVFLYHVLGGRFFFHIFRALKIAKKGPNNMVARRYHTEQSIRDNIVAAGGKVVHHKRSGFAPAHHTFIIDRVVEPMPGEGIARIEAPKSY